MKSIQVTTDNKRDSISIYKDDIAVVVLADRDDMAKLKDLEFAKQAGIYILLGKNKRYVGQASGSILNRLTMHDKQKDWWNRALFFSRKANDLGKDQTDYLESKLIAEFKKNSDVELENGNEGNVSNIDFDHQMMADNLWDAVQTILEDVANINLFQMSQNEVEDKKAFGEYSIVIPENGQRFADKYQNRPFYDFAKYLVKAYPDKFQEVLAEGRPLSISDGNAGKLLGTKKVISPSGNVLTQEISSGVFLYKHFAKKRTIWAIKKLADDFGVEVDINYGK